MLCATVCPAYCIRIEAGRHPDPRIEKYCRILYDQAVVAEGAKVKDPLAMAQRINELLVKDAAV